MRFIVSGMIVVVPSGRRAIPRYLSCCVVMVYVF